METHCCSERSDRETAATSAIATAVENEHSAQNVYNKHSHSAQNGLSRSKKQKTHHFSQRNEHVLISPPAHGLDHHDHDVGQGQQHFKVYLAIPDNTEKVNSLLYLSIYLLLSFHSLSLSLSLSDYFSGLFFFCKHHSYTPQLAF